MCVEVILTLPCVASTVEPTGIACALVSFVKLFLPFSLTLTVPDERATTTVLPVLGFGVAAAAVAGAISSAARTTRILTVSTLARSLDSGP